MSRRNRQFLYRFAAVLSLALWLALAAAEAWEPFHAWLHSGAIPAADNCPVAALQQGKLAASAMVVLAAVLLASVAAARFVAFPSRFAPPSPPDARGPPADRLAVVAA